MAGGGGTLAPVVQHRSRSGRLVDTPILTIRIFVTGFPTSVLPLIVPPTNYDHQVRIKSAIIDWMDNLEKC